MPPLIAALPAVAALASAGAGVAGAVAQGNNPGTQPLAPGVGQMNSGAFDYGGGTFKTPQQIAAEQAIGPAQAAAAAAQQKLAKMRRLQNAANSGGKVAANLTPEERQLIANPDAFDKAMTEALQGDTAAKAALATAQGNLKNGGSFAQAEADRYGGLAEAARNDKGPQVDLTNYNQTREQAQAARGAELEALGLSRDAALGLAPSAAEATLQKGLDASNQGAASLAASARGGGGNLALAGLQAGQQQAQNSATARQDASILRANEMAAARQAFQDGAIKQRANELVAQGLDEKTAMDVASNEQATKNRNALQSVSYEGLRQGVIKDQGQGRQNYETGNAKLGVDVATGNRTAQGQGFQDQQHAISTAFTAGGQALPVVTGAVEKYIAPSPAKTAPVKTNAPTTKPGDR